MPKTMILVQNMNFATKLNRLVFIAIYNELIGFYIKIKNNIDNINTTVIKL